MVVRRTMSTHRREFVFLLRQEGSGGNMNSSRSSAIGDRQSPALKGSDERLPAWLDLQLRHPDDLCVAAFQAVIFLERVVESTREARCSRSKRNDPSLSTKRDQAAHHISSGGSVADEADSEGAIGHGVGQRTNSSTRVISLEPTASRCPRKMVPLAER
jgi:hypothetical protein